jgi:hypothetical protein
MHEAPADHTAPRVEDTSRSAEQPEQHSPGVLSQSDPEAARSTGRPPIWLTAIIVLLVGGFVVLHLAGVFGPGMH